MNTIAERVLTYMKEHPGEQFDRRQLAAALAAKASSVNGPLAALHRVGAIKVVGSKPRNGSTRGGRGYLSYEFHHTPRKLPGIKAGQKPRRKYTKHAPAERREVASGPPIVKLFVSVGGYEINMTFAEANDLFNQLKQLFAEVRIG